MAPEDNRVHIVDLEIAGWESALIEACETLGFVRLVNHGVDARAAARLRASMVDLFALDDNTKHDLAIERGNYRGFIPLGFFTPNRAEVNGRDGDFYEGYKVHWECPADHPVRHECALYGPNRWPDDVPLLPDAVSGYVAACDQLTQRLLPVFARYLELEADVFASWFSEPLSNMTLLHYPAFEHERRGIHAHKDTNVITFLWSNVAGGLELCDRSGTWIDVDHVDGAIVMNIGEMLELWSGGRLIATPHRAANNGSNARYSFPYFVVPRHDVVVEPVMTRVAGFARRSMPVGELSAEVWRTNWPDETPSSDDYDLGSLR